MYLFVAAGQEAVNFVRIMLQRTDLAIAILRDLQLSYHAIIWQKRISLPLSGCLHKE